MQDFVGYMFFSFIEGSAVFALMFGIFRIKISKFLTPIILLNLFINLQSFFVREEFSLTAISPMLNLIICIFFLTIFIKIPFIWSTVITFTGYIAFSLVQTAIVFFSFGYFSIAQVQELMWKAYAVQAITGFIGIIVGYAIYRLGYGFTYDFENLRFKWERVLIVSLIVAFLSALIIVMVYRFTLSNLVVFAIALVFFLIYSLWKDADE